MISDDQPVAMIEERPNDNDKQNTVSDKRQPSTLDSRSVTTLGEFSFLQGRVDPTVRVEAQGPIDIGTYLDSRSTTHERRTTSNVLSCDTSNFDQKRLVSQLTQALFSFDGSGTSLEAFGVTIDLILAQLFEIRSGNNVTNKFITLFPDRISKS